MTVINSKQAAAILNVNVSTVGNLARKGKIPSVMVGRAYAFDEDELRAFAKTYRKQTHRRNQIQIIKRRVTRTPQGVPAHIAALNKARIARGEEPYVPIGRK